MAGRHDGGAPDDARRRRAAGPAAGVTARAAASGGGAGVRPAGDRAPDEALLAKARAAPVLAGPLPSFDPRTAPASPGDLFAAWLEQALDDGVPEPHVMTLSTASADAVPDARVLVLRGIDTAACAYAFATDTRSPKAADLAANPRAALSWYWPAHGRQIRMAGRVEVRGPEATRRDFLGRGPHARAAAFAGPMSAPLAGPEEYERAMAEARGTVAAEPERVPATHVLYQLRAERAEFWQADPPRFHLRLRYTRDAATDAWDRDLLWP
ncbi:pyridoxine/pyridoxamine 5'-phosphate oxidase [Actinacidiphila yeochonensis]|uniref:pyridoxine/pyridoxamine 5'-phosphate oxidase n=1 Tax=Actinacidiphila yeochonensis TaxID=89050 RepID=UPI000A40E358|nr:pyridoxamine 5'-phosphate oxidase family protein [Actinacidiphila yeochonensis]